MKLILLNSHEYVPFDTQMNNTLRLIGGGCLLYIYHSSARRQETEEVCFPINLRNSGIGNGRE